MILRGLLILLVGAGALAGAAWLAVEQGRFLKVAQRAPGEVVALNAGGSHPQIRFEGSTGEAISYPQGGLIWGYREGMQVEVLYDPADPRRTPVVKDACVGCGMCEMICPTEPAAIVIDARRHPRQAGEEQTS